MPDNDTYIREISNVGIKKANQQQAMTQTKKWKKNQKKTKQPRKL